jgi:hypothetical protein
MDDGMMLLMLYIYYFKMGGFMGGGDNYNYCMGVGEVVVVVRGVIYV